MRYNIISKLYRFFIDEKRQDKVFYRFFAIAGVYFGFHLLIAIVNFIFRVIYG